jgi:hypothetical protein
LLTHESVTGDRFRVELDRLRFEFGQLQREHERGYPDSDSLRRHLDGLRRWIADVEKFRRRFLVVQPDQSKVPDCS